MGHRLSRFFAFLIVAALFLVPGFAMGQARTEGQLSGTVVDASGAGVPGATLTLSQASTGFRKTVTSGDSGDYVFPDLQAGSYTLNADAKGFAPAVYNDVVVYAGRSTDLKVSVKVGTSVETVEVSAEAEVLETTSNTLATTVAGDSIQNLPLNGRDALPFAQLMPGAQVGGDLRFTTYDAMPNGAINISVDGTNDNFSRFRSSTTGFYTGAGLRIGAVDEMTVSTDQLAADAAAEGAVTLSVTIKHGTNSFHGNGFWEAYNSAFNANSFQNDTFMYDAHQLCPSGFTRTAASFPNAVCNAAASDPDPGTANAYWAAGRKQPSHVNDFGGSVGGPILKNKLFFFFNYEREVVPGTNLAQTGIPNAAAQAGTFSYTDAGGNPETVNLYNIAAAYSPTCNTAAGFNCNLGATINPNIASLFTTINGYAGKGTLQPLNTDSQVAAIMNVVNFNYTNTVKQVWPTLRIDYQIKPTILWHTSYNMYWRVYPGSPIYPTDPILESAFQSTYSTFATGLDWTINSHLVNQANFGVLNEQEEFQAGNKFDAFQGITYLPVASGLGGPGTGIGYQSGSGFFNAPVPDSGSVLPEPRNSPVRNVTDNLTWTRGQHTITFGGEFRDSSAFDTGTQPPIAQNLGITGTDPAQAMFNTNNVAPGGGACTSDTQGCFPGGLGTAGNNEAAVDAKALYSLLTGRVASINGNLPLNTLKKPYTYAAGGITKLEEQFKEGGFYVQDAWKVTPHLSLNYGLRFQFTGAITNTNNYFTGPTYTDLLGPSSALFQPGQLTGDTNPQITLRPKPYNNNFKQPAPRFGFAWNPDYEDGILGKLFSGSKTVVRGGYAINYYDEGTIPWENVAAGGLANENFFFNQGSGPGLFAPGSLSFDPANPAPTSINSFPNTGGAFNTPLPESEFTFTGLGSFSTVNPHIHTPYVQNWSFGIQRQLPGNWVLELNYVGNHSVHMWDAYDLNEVNIFQNVSGFDSFLQDFQNAQANLTASGGTTFAGPNPTPILSQAYAGQPLGNTFQNPSNIFLVQTGQAGALAGSITQNFAYFCNLVWTGFTPCVNQGYLTAGTPLPAGAQAYPINFFQVNPYATGNTLFYLSDPGSENYNGLHINMKHPVGHGLNFLADYAYSHAFTNRYLGDYYTADSAISNFWTLRDPHLNRVPSPYDLRHTFNALLTYDLPFGPGKAFDAHNWMLNRVIGGWTVGTIFNWQIGRNFKLAGGQDTTNWFDSFQSTNYSFPPDPTDSGVVLTGISRSQLQSEVGVHPSPIISDTAGGLCAMPSPPAGCNIPNPNIQALGLPTSLFGAGGAVQPETTPGVIAPPMFLHGPMFVNTNFSVTKLVPIWQERVGLKIHAEFVNLFNHPNFNYTDSYSFGTNNPAQYLFVNAPPYSPLTVNQGGNRQIQFRLEAVF